MREGFVRRLVEEAVDRMVEGEPGNRVLDRVLRAHRDLTSDERAAVADWSYGLALWRLRIDRLAGGRRALWMPLFLVDQRGRSVREAARLCGGDPVSIADALRSPPSFADPIEDLAFRRSLPEWIASRWIEQFGAAEADALAAATNERGPVAIRTNKLRTTREFLEEALAAEGIQSRRSRLVAGGLILEGRANVFGSESWRRGLFEVQDEGSQLVAEAVNARPGETIIDLCAGAGGKTLALAAAMENRGRITAVDVDAGRLTNLRARAARAGATCIDVREADATDPSGLSGLEGADVVLVDAPCSGLGILRRGPDSRFRISPDDLRAMVRLQHSLLAAAARLVRPGGRLVYATCSVDREENESVAESLEGPFTEVDRRRTWPHRDGCDGFFWTVWRRGR